tara:strand:- start:938 stop:1384 length:447 start_codon:yes stop_codon:yes gene_type:complete
MLSKVFPHELSDEDLKHFYAAIKTDEHSGPPDGVAMDIYDGKLEVWHWKTEDSSVIVITDIVEYRDGYREMFVVMCAGSGALKNQSDGWDSLKVYAKERRCSEITAYVKPDIAADTFNLISKPIAKEDRSNNGLFKFDVSYVVISMRV